MNDARQFANAEPSTKRPDTKATNPTASDRKVETRECLHLHIERIDDDLHCYNCGLCIDDSEWIDNYTPEDEELR